ncbi:MAG: 4Fe-4S dicluster domain-containing protein [Clostridiales bacterium]|nr:4Fe-4S dicluster domain-containing protein [Clostridiales bacterium]
MSKVFTIDVARCSGCYNCQIACKDEHAGNDWTPYAKPQPLVGQFWLKVKETVHGTIPKVKIHYTPKLCNHCEKPSCIGACGNGAIYKREDGLVLIDPEKCKGCKKCASACPYEVIYFNDDLNISQKCTGCAHLLDNGKSIPRCVEACPTGALRFGEKNEMAEQLTGTVVLSPETGLLPNVYYKNIPGLFIAGTLYDPIEEEIIEGAACHLSCGPRVWDTVTDDFGDFWFKDLPAGKYELAIKAPGFALKHISGIDAGSDVNLGDIPLDQQPPL